MVKLLHIIFLCCYTYNFDIFIIIRIYFDESGVFKMVKNKIKAINKAYDYITNVTTKQERLLDFDEIYIGYLSTIRKNRLTSKGFKIVYDVIEKIIIGGRK